MGSGISLYRSFGSYGLVSEKSNLSRPPSPNRLSFGLNDFRALERLEECLLDISGFTLKRLRLSPLRRASSEGETGSSSSELWPKVSSNWLIRRRSRLFVKVSWSPKSFKGLPDEGMLSSLPFPERLDAEFLMCADDGRGRVGGSVRGLVLR